MSGSTLKSEIEDNEVRLIPNRIEGSELEDMSASETNLYHIVLIKWDRRQMK